MSGNRLLALIAGVFLAVAGLSALLGALDVLPVAEGRPKGLQFAIAAIAIPLGAILLAVVARAMRITATP